MRTLPCEMCGEEIQIAMLPLHSCNQNKGIDMSNPSVAVVELRIRVQQIIDRSSHCVVEDGAGKWHNAVKAKIADLYALLRQQPAGEQNAAPQAEVQTVRPEEATRSPAGAAPTVSERGLGAAVDLILREVENARRKHPAWPANDTLFAAAIVSEESGELMRAAVQHKGEGGSLDACDKEAIQTAAVAIRFLERK